MTHHNREQEKTVVWHCRDGNTSVMVPHVWRERCYGVAGVMIQPPLAVIKSEQRFWT